MVVIGAGVIGLATARALAQAGREVILVEAASAIGTETSSRNSEVIHAGLYYPAGSLKATRCVEGRRRLYAYCEARGVPHRRCGKLVVAADDADVDALTGIAARARQNGVDDIALIDARALEEREPALVGRAALLSPSTGIVDTHALMMAYLDDAETAGAALALRTPVIGGTVVADGVLLHLGGDEPMRLRARHVVNAAGLSAWDVSRSLAGLPTDPIPPRRLCKGSYFSLIGRAPARHLVYPVPSAAGLGTHLTLDLAGKARFGPDVEWVDGIDYRVDPARGEQFYAAIRRYWPGLPDGALQPDYAGIRPKVVGPGDPAADFVVQSPEGTGAAGYVALYGIESPGITASLALADRIVRCLGREL